MHHVVEVEINDQPLRLETGAVARQADGAVVIRHGGTVVVATIVAERTQRQGRDFLPLTVEYRERAYAGGRIPGNYFRREGAPTKKETLTARLIDRPIRPLFPRGFRNEVQVVCLVVSADQENDPDVLAVNGASAALCLSGVPFAGPVGAVRVGLVDGRFIVNPTMADRLRSAVDLVVAGSAEGVLMVEAGARELSEQTMLEAIACGQAACMRLVRAQQELVAQAGKPRWTSGSPAEEDVDLRARVGALVGTRLGEAFAARDKRARAEALARLFDEVCRTLDPDERRRAAVREAFEAVERDEVRRVIVERGVRVDGRKLNEIRAITIEVPSLPQAHGSCMFTRGETQALVSATLGTKEDEQKIEALEGEHVRHFMLHYNFPAFSVGEVRRFGSPSRRDIGHGALAERAVEPVLPSREAFPYTIRVVSDLLEANGSTSMATVCGASLALMDAGVPIRAHVAGIAMGLVKEGDRVAVLTDIVDMEDHHGDMDFKVAGSEAGVTALQMDIKVPGLAMDTLQRAFDDAREARLALLARMREAIAQPRPSVSPRAPHFVTLAIARDKIRELIGPGGRVIRSLQERTGARVDVQDDGRVTVFARDHEAAQHTRALIEEIVREVELDRVHLGKVTRIAEFGAFVEILPNTEGLLHVSQIAEERIRAVEDVLGEGDLVAVKVIEVQGNGRIRLSRKLALREDPAMAGLERRQAAGPRES